MGLAPIQFPLRKLAGQVLKATFNLCERKWFCNVRGRSTAAAAGGQAEVQLEEGHGDHTGVLGYPWGKSVCSVRLLAGGAALTLYHKRTKLFRVLRLAARAEEAPLLPGRAQQARQRLVCSEEGIGRGGGGACALCQLHLLLIAVCSAKVRLPLAGMDEAKSVKRTGSCIFHAIIKVLFIFCEDILAMPK